MPSFHNVQAGYNLQNMQNPTSSRNTGMGVPSSAGQPQPAGNLAPGRFATNPGNLPQMSHAALHGHNVMSNRGGLNVVGNLPFGAPVNGIGAGPGGSVPGAGTSVGNPRGGLGTGMGAASPQVGGPTGRIGTPGGVNMGGPPGGGGLSGAGGAGNLNRNISAGGGVNLGALGSSRGLGAGGLGSLGNNGYIGVQGPGRPAGIGMLPQGVNMPSSTYNPSGDLLAMISRGTTGNVLLGNNFSAAPGGSLQGQSPPASGQLGQATLGQEGGNPEDLAFDINEFPTLSARPTSASSSLQSAAAAAALRKGVPVNALVQQNSEFSIQNEDFPALPGFKAGGNGEIGSEMQHHKEQHENALVAAMQSQHFQGQAGLAALRGLGAAPGGPGLGQYEQLMSQQHQFQQQQQQQSFLRLGQHQQLIGGGVGGGGGGGGGGGLGGGVGPSQQLLSKDAGVGVGVGAGMGGALKGSSSQPRPSTPPHDHFGLLGLLSVIRMSDQDLTMVALGTDLTTLGLNLNSRENLYKTFASPWADGPTRGEPDFTLPLCYIQAAPRLQPGYFTKFQQDTLFYIFYSMPNEEAQVYAADELCQRGWFYHKEHQMWFTRVPSTEPQVKTAAYERGSYYFFDPTVWETGRKDNFVVQYELLEARPQVPPPPR